jgi:WD40 repeat protein
MTRVFLSYARADDEEPFDPRSSFAARLYRDLSAAGFDVWFDRVSMPSRALTFHQEIRDAVASCDRVVLLVGPHTAGSLYVRQEWQFAYFWDSEGRTSAEKIVTPILVRGDYPSVPAELALLHCEDFRDLHQYDFHLQNLARELREPAPALGRLIGVPALPLHLLPRSDRLAAVRDGVRADLDHPVVITGAAARVGLYGMGGIGKSVLAATLARDRKVREAFPDGIVWVTFGASPNIVELQRRVDKDLDGRGAFDTEHEGRAALGKRLADARVLLIFDDVWRRSDLDGFDSLGSRCRALITTRDAGLLGALGGAQHRVDLLTDGEAMELLAQAAGIELASAPAETAEIIRQCGRLPLAVAICGGLIRDGFGWDAVLQQLRLSRIDRLEDLHAVRPEHESVWNVIDVSVRFLEPGEQARFLELAAFPSDERWPLAAVATLWSHPGGLDVWASQALVQKLSQRSLLDLTRIASGPIVGLHDLVHDYVRHASGDGPQTHQRLLDAYARQFPGGWHVNPPNDGYLPTHLRHHLVSAARLDDLSQLLCEPRWLEFKCENDLTFDVPLDFASALAALPASDSRAGVLRLLDEAFRRDIHFVARHPDSLFQCMWNSCWWYGNPASADHYATPDDRGAPPHPDAGGQRLTTILEAWRKDKGRRTPPFPWIRSLRPPTTRLGGPLRLVLQTLQHYPNFLACSPDGTRLATSGEDRTIRVWDLATARQLLEMRPEDHLLGGVENVAYTPDGTHLVSTDYLHISTHKPAGGVIRVWDARTGRQVLRIHNGGTLMRLAISPDGQHVAVCMGDGKVGVWELRTGKCLHNLDTKRGALHGIAFSPDGTRFAAVSGGLWIWSFETGALLLHAETATSGSNDLAFSPDGSQVAITCAGPALRIVDSLDGRVLHTLGELAAPGEFKSSFSDRVVYSPSGEFVAMAGDDPVVRIWNAQSGDLYGAIRSGSRSVRCIAYAPNGSCIAGICSDNVIRVWYCGAGTSQPVLVDHAKWVSGIVARPDGRQFATTSDDNTIRIWDFETGRLLRTLTDHTEWTRGIAYSRDNRWLATGSGDKKVRLRDAETGTTAYLLNHEAWVDAVRFSNDSRLLASVGSSGEVRLWEVSTGRLLSCIEGRGHGLEWVAFSDDDAWIRADHIDEDFRSVHVWNVSDGCHIGDWRYWEFPDENARRFAEVTGESPNLAPQEQRRFEANIRQGETAITAPRSNSAVAWYPVALWQICKRPGHNTWSGSQESRVFVLTLEGG